MLSLEDIFAGIRLPEVGIKPLDELERKISKARLPRKKLITPLGHIELPEIPVLPLFKIPRLDERRRRALANAIAIDLAEFIRE